MFTTVGSGKIKENNLKVHQKGNGWLSYRNIEKLKSRMSASSVSVSQESCSWYIVIVFFFKVQSMEHSKKQFLFYNRWGKEPYIPGHWAELLWIWLSAVQATTEHLCGKCALVYQTKMLHFCHKIVILWVSCYIC